MTTPTGTTRGHRIPDGPMVPGGADPQELCTSPDPAGRSCLQLVARRRAGPVCDECADQLGQMLDAAGVSEPEPADDGGRAAYERELARLRGGAQ